MASMADIAFMLLIFFLVATTMDMDSGLQRVLPPMPEDDQIEEDQQIRERNVFIVLVNARDQLMVEGENIPIELLRERAKEFIANPNDEPHLPEKEMKEVPYFGEVYATRTAIISLQNDRGTSYGMYIRVQNELAAAYRELRDDLAMEQFGRPFNALGESEQEAVREIYPMTISEAEPREVGGN